MASTAFKSALNNARRITGVLHLPNSNEEVGEPISVFDAKPQAPPVKRETLWQGGVVSINIPKEAKCIPDSVHVGHPYLQGFRNVKNGKSVQLFFADPSWPAYSEENKELETVLRTLRGTAVNARIAVCKKTFEDGSEGFYVDFTIDQGASPDCELVVYEQKLQCPTNPDEAFFAQDIGDGMLIVRRKREQPCRQKEA